MLSWLPRFEEPKWLMNAKLGDSPLPIEEILRGSVYYPASGMDGRPVQYFGGFAHSFVYADCNISKSLLKRQLDTFKGYRICHLRSVTKEQLCFNPFTPIHPGLRDGDPGRVHQSSEFEPYAFWAVYERCDGIDDSHGPQRFSLLFIGGEGVATFQSLYYSNQCAPSLITLIKCDAFTGNWTSFLDAKKIFARSVIRNQAGMPEYLFCDYGDAVSPWPWYSELIGTIAVPPFTRLRLWKLSKQSSSWHKSTLQRGE